MSNNQEKKVLRKIDQNMSFIPVAVAEKINEIIDYLYSMKEERVSYNKTDHIHCWSQENPPCGFKGKHRCCLCNEPVPPEHKEEDWQFSDTLELMAQKSD